jgi:hypothetical protein
VLLAITGQVWDKRWLFFTFQQCSPITSTNGMSGLITHLKHTILLALGLHATNEVEHNPWNDAWHHTGSHKMIISKTKCVVNA